MIDFLGFFTIVFVFFITIVLSEKFKAISKIILIAFTIRILFLILNNFFFYLPDGDMDALNFELRAANLSEVGISNIFKYYPGPDTYFLSFLYAIPYSIFGKSFLMLQSLSIMFGIFSVILGWLITKKIWDNYTAIKVCWTIALFPSLVSYSVLTMREVYITFFLLLGFYGIVSWVREKNFKSIILSSFGFLGATFFHGASALGLMIFIIIVAFDSIKNSYQLLRKKIINIRLLFLFLLSIIFLTLYFSNKIHIPYLKSFEDVNTDHMKMMMKVNTKGDASYPSWLRIETDTEFLYKLPARSLYFLFAPFPWDIKKAYHLIGLFDSLLYISLIYLILRNRKMIFKDPALKIIMFILIVYFIAFAIGVSNFGTGIRHRAKFVVELILLAGPFLPNFIFNKISFRRNYSSIKK